MGANRRFALIRAQRVAGFGRLIRRMPTNEIRGHSPGKSAANARPQTIHERRFVAVREWSVARFMQEVLFFQFYGKMKEFRAKLIITKFVENKISYKMVLL